MALPIYIEIEATTSGKIEGGSTRKSREGMIEGVEAHHLVEIPTDRLTGRATGNRVHGPFVFTKEIDKASPYIQKMLVTGENIKKLTSHFWMITPDGKEKEFYNIVIEDAQVTSVTTILPNVHHEGKEKPMEQVSVRYSTITWTYTDGNIMATDSYYQPA
jgi:type VI secretion system secreted protein Hcp